MKRFALDLMLVLFTVTAITESAKSLDWPQWQGPDRNAVSQETGLLQEWTNGGPPLAWKIGDLGGGYSAPSIAAGRIFGMSNRGGDEVVWALSEADGSTLWSTKLGPAQTEGRSQGKEGPGCSPTVDGDRLYVLGAGGTLACLQAADGQILWQRSLTEDFGGHVPTWRYNESPLVDGDKVVCTPGGEDATLVALDKLSGETIWQSRASDGPAEEESADRISDRARDGLGGGDNTPARGRGGFSRGRGGFGRGPSSGAAYSSAIAIDFDGQRQYVQLTAKALVGVAASDGELLWQYGRPANGMGINCSTPVHEDGLVFAASAYGAGGGLVRLSNDASGAVQAEEVYSTTRMQNHHGGMIVLDGCLYGAAGGNGGGFLVCLDFQTGETLWREREAPKGSLALADGRLYLRAEDGTLLLIEPNREQFVERGRIDQPDRSPSPAWTHPVIANGKLYVRDQDVLLCYDIKAN